MKTLKVWYARTAVAGATSQFRELLHVAPQQGWDVQEMPLDELWSKSEGAHVVWLDLGRDAASPRAMRLVRRMADFTRSTSRTWTVMLSGQIPKTETRLAAVEAWYDTFADPAKVEVDLVGKPDVAALCVKIGKLLEATRDLELPNADLRSDRGNLSIQRLAELYAIDVIEIGRLIGRDNKAALSKTPDADSLQESLRPFADIALLRSPRFDDVAFRKWLRSPHSDLQNSSPLDWIRKGRVSDVAGFVHGILSGQPG